MASKKSDESEAEKKLKELEAKIKKLEEVQRESPDKKAPDGPAGGVLRSIGDMIPGLGGLIENVSQSPAFQERLGKINEELDRKLRETPLKRVEPEVAGGVSRHPMGIPPRVRSRQESAARTPKIRVKQKQPEQQLTSESPEEIQVDVFDEDDYVLLIAELPGVEESDIELTVEDGTLSISANAEGAKRVGKVSLPCPTEGEPEFSLAKGILKVKVKKAKNND